jgi:hypothetical protein
MENSVNIENKMDPNDIYLDYPELQTAEEKEVIAHVPNVNPLPEIPPKLREACLAHKTYPPDAKWRAQFEKRPPANGFDMSIIEEILAFANDPRYLPAQRRRLFQCLRDEMLKYLIPCSDCSTIEHLCDVLKGEIVSGIPSPVPEWYVYSTGPAHQLPRRVGYYFCCNRECFKTEHYLKPAFLKCGSCATPTYCSKDCKKSDWVSRHNFVCKEAKYRREYMKNASQLYGEHLAPKIDDIVKNMNR